MITFRTCSRIWVTLAGVLAGTACSATGARTMTDAGATPEAGVATEAGADPIGGEAGAPDPADAPVESDAAADAAAPDTFWDPSDIPPAKNVMMFKFLNRTNGVLSDAEVFWSFKSGDISETHSIAEQPLYDMPANSVVE